MIFSFWVGSRIVPAERIVLCCRFLDPWIRWCWSLSKSSNWECCYWCWEYVSQFSGSWPIWKLQIDCWTDHCRKFKKEQMTRQQRVMIDFGRECGPKPEFGLHMFGGLTHQERSRGFCMFLQAHHQQVWVCIQLGKQLEFCRLKTIVEAFKGEDTGNITLLFERLCPGFGCRYGCPSRIRAVSLIVR